MELWKKLLITLFTIGIIIAIIVIIFAISAKCKADQSQSSLCKFANGVTDFVNDLIQAIKYAVYIALGGLILGILAGIARFFYGLWKGDGDPIKPADPKDSNIGDNQDRAENGEPLVEDTDEVIDE